MKNLIIVALTCLMAIVVSGCVPPSMARDLTRQIAVDAVRTGAIRAVENSVDARYGNPRQPQTNINVNPKYQNGQEYYSGQMTDGSHYEGGMVNGSPHGFGSYVWTNGNKYIGEFRGGQLSGQGTFTDSNGHKFVGEFRNGFMNGQGESIYSDGRKYIGEFRDGLPHGFGKLHNPNGTVKVGTWWKGEFVE